MGKRASDYSEGLAAYNKRPKTHHHAPTGEDVYSSEQLKGLLAFDQNLRNARHGLQSFKKLLDGAISPDAADRQAKIGIIRGYLKAVQPRDSSQEAVFLSDIMEMWSFASQVNDDGVMSSAAVVLDLLLQVISNNLDLVPIGLGIGRTLLQDCQLKSLSRSLSADRGKGFVISPALRLLREIVCLDGGALAKQVFRARTFTFASLARNLEIANLGDSPEDVNKASIRTNAVRFFLACLKFLNADGRKSLLAQKELLSHLTFMMKSDPSYLVLEIMDSLQTNILMDLKINREIKFKNFNTRTLMRFLGLYTYNNGPANDADQVIERAHRFLIHICTESNAGVLYPSKGLYPKESNEENHPTSRHGSQAKVDGNLWSDKFRDGVPVFNFVLSEFACKLRPWSSLKHNELLVAIFKAAPELIADYFFNNKSFTFEPKLSMTWIGYAAFLFNTMMLPFPPAFGDAASYANIPPPTSILLDNIVPRPINQKVLIRCFSPKSHLTSFFATRILIQALEKLAVALKMHKDGGRGKKQLWNDASRRLIDAFCQRITDMKEIVRCYKAIPPENVLHRTLTSRLLRLYYEIVPRVALAANFDVSPFFADVLRTIRNQSVDAGTASFAVMELQNLVSIASYSPGMRWFARPDAGGGEKGLSAFTALLQILCESDDTAPLAQLQSVLADVAVENQLVARDTRMVALLRALRRAAANEATKNIPWGYLDNCISRCAGSPIKYLEQIKAVSDNTQFSLLNIVFQDQLSFALGDTKKAAIVEIGKFLSFYFNALALTGESKKHLEDVYSKICEQFSATKAIKMTSLGDKAERKALQRIDVQEEAKPGTADDMAKQPRVMIDEAQLEEILDQPLSFEEDNNALTKWSSKNVEDVVEDGLAVALVKLLASPHINIRKEALTNILKLAAKIKESSYEEKEQVWLLLSELAESSRPQVDAGPAPSSFISFSVHALDVVRSPLHPLYPKINAFLTRGPVWPPDKLPMAHDILHGEPGDDDRYYAELAWLLDHLLDSLRSEVDLGVFRRKRWLEKILALASNPCLRANLRTRILRIVYRATRIEGGSTTLVTRFGVVTWLDGQRGACGSPEDAAVYAALMRRTWETCDQERVRAWSKGGVEKLVEAALS